MNFNLLLFCCFLVITGCSSVKRSSTKAAAVPAISGLKFLDEYQIPFKFQFNNTQVGGLSGIDYNEAEKKFYFISDDRSNTNPARFYTADIRISNSQIDSILFLSVDTLRQPNGTPFPSHRQFAFKSSDPESIRYHAGRKSFVWTSEGERTAKNNSDIFQQPFVYEMDRRGYFLDSLFIPSNLQMMVGETGPRRNSVFEGCSLSPDQRYLFVSCEEPLLQDGSPATTGFAGALARITKFDMSTKKATAQFAYPLDAIAHPPKPAGAFAINGISEILCLDDHQLLVVERSFSTGRLIQTIKIYLADISKASNVLQLSSLKTKKLLQQVKKKLLLDTDLLSRYIDNIEGICFGPLLPNGRRSLLLVSDDNFNPLQKTQVLLFEIEE
jgi:hypothetical protein